MQSWQIFAFASENLPAGQNVHSSSRSAHTSLVTNLHSVPQYPEALTWSSSSLRQSLHPRAVHCVFSIQIVTVLGRAGTEAALSSGSEVSRAAHYTTGSCMSFNHDRVQVSRLPGSGLPRLKPSLAELLHSSVS